MVKHMIVTWLVLAEFFIGIILAYSVLCLPSDACKIFNPTKYSVELCKRVFTSSSIMLHWNIWKPAIMIHQVLMPCAIYHNVEGRVNLPLLQIASFCYAFISISDLQQLEQSRESGEIEVIP